MPATHKPFRELIKPGSNFEFVAKTRLWVTISVILIAASIGMLFVNKAVRGDYLNWNIDFKGGTELIFEFRDERNPVHHVAVGAGAIRGVLLDAGYRGFEVSNLSWQDDSVDPPEPVEGMILRTPYFSALTDEEKDTLREAFVSYFSQWCRGERGKGAGEGAGSTAPRACEVVSALWSGDRLDVRTRTPVPESMAAAFFASHGKTMKPFGDMAEVYAEEEQGTGEFKTQMALEGLDKEIEETLTAGIDGAIAKVVQVYGVSAKAGAQLRNDGVKSLFYVLILIVLYLAFRFDIRYAPGAVIALLHDAILVVGVFAVTYADVSLTSVAALLTVIGYSVNDTVVVFDRIRENLTRLKDKKLPRIVNISLNETLSRTLLTSLTLFVVTIMMNVFGTGLVRNFAFAMNIGVVVGVYSTVFIASPVFLYLDRRFYPARGPTKGEGARKKAVRA